MTLPEINALERIVGKSRLIRDQIERCASYCRSKAAVLIYGETGTGKEIFARAIHDAGLRATGPFVAVNCGALPYDLAESQFFGHEAGAFTGAVRRQKGLVEQAEGGTLFLDEVNSLPLLAQSKLLRFLQEGECRALGSTAVHKADVRVISASNMDLDKAVTAGSFRSDLCFRLNVLSLSLPPLRARLEDIPLIAEHLIARHCADSNLSSRRLTAAALEKLMSYNWPGNVRELENVIQRSLALCPGPLLDATNLDMPANGAMQSSQSYKAQRERNNYQWEEAYLRQLMAQHPGNISEAARAAGLDRKSVYRLLEKHRLSPQEISGGRTESLRGH